MPLALVAGSASRPFAHALAQELGVRPAAAEARRFPDGEAYVRLLEPLAGQDVAVVQSTAPDPEMVELLLWLDAVREAGARSVTAVVPYFGYARQDRKVKPRTPISAKLVADLLGASGADRVVAVDLHAGQIQGFFDIPVDHLFAMPVMIDYLQRQGVREAVIVSPDAGGVERARAYAKRLSSTLAIIDKRRSGPNVSEVMNIVGDVRGKDAIIVDDMVDTAGTLCQAARAVMDAGARTVSACATHGVFSGPAVSRIEDSPLSQVVVTDTIPLRPEAKACKKIHQLSVARLLGEAIKRIHHGDSISSLFI